MTKIGSIGSQEMLIVEDLVRRRIGIASRGIYAFYNGWMPEYWRMFDWLMSCQRHFWVEMEMEAILERSARHLE